MENNQPIQQSNPEDVKKPFISTPLKRSFILFYFTIPLLFSSYFLVMTILFSGFAITDSGKDSVNKIITAALASILWHTYFLNALRKQRLWTWKAGIMLVVVYTLLLQFYAFSKLYPIYYLFRDTGTSLLEILRIGFMSFLVIGTSNLPLAIYSLMGWAMLFLLIADKKLVKEFWSNNPTFKSDTLITNPQEIGVIEKEKIVLSEDYPMIKIFFIRIYFTIPILAVVLWFAMKGITAGMCMQIAYCDMPVLFPNTLLVILSIVLGVIYLFFWSSVLSRKRWTRIAGIIFAFLIGITLPNILIILFTGLILHYLVFDASVKKAFSN